MKVDGIVLLPLSLTTNDKATWPQEVRYKWKRHQKEKGRWIENLRIYLPNPEKQRKQQKHSLVTCSWFICLFVSLLIHISPLPCVSDSSPGWPKWHGHECLFNVSKLPPIDTHQQEHLQTNLNIRETDTTLLPDLHPLWKKRKRSHSDHVWKKELLVGGTHTVIVSALPLPRSPSGLGFPLLCIVGESVSNPTFIRLGG